MSVAIVIIRATKTDPERAPGQVFSSIFTGIVRGTGKQALERAARPLEIELESKGYNVAAVEFYRDPLGWLGDNQNAAFMSAMPNVGKG